MFDTLMVRILLVLAGVRERVDRLRRAPDAGYNTEATVVIALLAAAAIAVAGIIINKVTTRANTINLNPVP